MIASDYEISPIIGRTKNPDLIGLKAKGLGKRFGRRILFKDIGISLKGGESLAITGPNGSGKSTLVGLLAGVIAPSKGDVFLTSDKAQLNGTWHSRQVGMVAPYMNVYDGLSAEENLQFIAKVRSMENPKVWIEEVLDHVQLSDRKNDMVGTFSSGMKQRVKYAAALFARPLLMILDEPTANLDEVGIEMIEKIIQWQKAQNGMLIVATNVPAETAWCDNILNIPDYL